MQITRCIALALAVGAGSLATAAPTRIEQHKAAEEFRKQNPRARIAERFGRPHKIAAKQMATGRTAYDSAGKARDSVTTMLGVDADEFISAGPFPNGAHSIQLGYQADTDTYKFTSVYWTQTADGLPVFRTRLNVLVRNVPGYPAVYITSDLRDVAGFEAPDDLSANVDLARAAANRRLGIGARLTEPGVICFAGIDDMRIEPRAAMVFEAEIGSKFDNSFEKYLLVVDLLTGVVLHEEDRILNAVSGTVNGLASEGSGADECELEILTPMPYATVSGNGQTVYADVEGNFTLDSSGGNVSVTAGVVGQYFNVNNQAGGDTSGSTTIPDGGYGAVTLNSANTDEFVRAQVNCYYESNVVRDFTLYHSPSYPQIGGETGFPVNVNISDYCNAFYDYSSINFFRAGSGCNNTGFSVVVHHEYGHHIVAVGGSGQDAFGEGFGDVMGVLITGDPMLARGFYQGDCMNGIRNADNNYQYPCSGGIHDCGQLLSGCAWDVLLLMEETYSDGHFVTSQLLIDMVTLHSGGGIDPTITLDILTLDDDDGDLDNGTPHSPEILAGMAMHSMDEIPEPLGNDFCSDAYPVVDGSTAFSTVGAFSDSDPYNDAQCTGTYLGEMVSDVWFSYEACESGSMTVSTCDSISFDSDIVVYEGTCEDKTQVACNGDGSGCGGYSSTLTFTAVEGESYLIRVGGWDSSSIGSGNLQIDGPGDGPPCNNLVDIELPSGAPEQVDPAGGTTLDVRITPGEAYPEGGTELLYYRSNGGDWIYAPLVNTPGTYDYVGTFPALECGTVDWYVACWAASVEVTLPANAPDSSFSSAVLTDVETAFADNFESEQGWTVINGATEGNWDRGVPAGDGGARCDNPTDGDGSGQCYVTGNAASEDVDGGTTTLTSPVITASSGSTVSYYRWYNNGVPCGGGDPLNDIMEVDISYDSGSTWENLETVGPTNEASGGWYQPSFVLGTLPNGTVMLRFVVGDLNDGSVIEAAVDGVLVEKPICDEEPACPGDLNGDSTVDVNDVLHLIAGWGGADGDVNGDGTTDVNDLLELLTLYGQDC